MLQEKDVRKLIQNGENSFVEFKEDAVTNKKLAREFVAFSNHKGGYILLGIGDDGSIKGLQRQDNEERIMNIVTDLVKPRILPAYYELRLGQTKIGIIEIEAGNNKPYYLEEKVMIDGQPKTVKIYYNCNLQNYLSKNRSANLVEKRTKLAL